MLVGVAGFEPTTSTSRTWRSTKLSYTPNGAYFMSLMQRKQTPFAMVV